MTAISTLSSIIGLRGKASKACYQQRPGFDLLEGCELIRSFGVVQSILCEKCDEPHDSEVIFEDGGYGAYCPDAGFVGLTRQEIEAIQPDIGKLVSSLADLFQCKRRKSTPVQAETWRIGAVDTQAGDLVVYFHPNLQTEQDAREVQAALSHETTATYRLIVTAVGTLTVLNAKTITLSDLIEFSNDTGKLARLSDLMAVSGAPQLRTNGRPSPYGDRLSLLIIQRIEGGTALTGLNEEARAIRNLFGAKYTAEAVPSTSTVKRKIRNLRAGS